MLHKKPYGSRKNTLDRIRSFTIFLAGWANKRGVLDVETLTADG